MAIDGKIVCNLNDDSSSKLAIHLVSAYANENGLYLGQIIVSGESVEISAIPKLLDILTIQGCIIIIDAMG